MVIKIRKTTDNTANGTRTFGWEIFDAENAAVVLQSGTEAHNATQATNLYVKQILNDLLAEYYKANALSESDMFLASAPPSVKYNSVLIMVGDQATGANTNPVSLPGLLFDYHANSVYRIWFMGRIQAAANTTGCGFQLDLSTAVTSVDIQFHHQLANTGTLTGGHSLADDASVAVSSGTPATAAIPVHGFGLLRTGANSGNAQLRFRSETTAVITAKAGLTLVLERIQ